MSEFKGTEGEWKLESKKPTSFPNVVLKTETKSLNIIVHLSSKELVRNDYKDGTYDYNSKGNISLSEENIANAKLIACAPKMLQALNRINELVYANTISAGDKEYFEIRNLCCDLIKEATE